jgi:hypothetical protein
MALTLSYCQLIRIILAQMGGSPVKQIYNQTTGGIQNIVKSLGIPFEELGSSAAQIQAFVGQVTTALKNASATLDQASIMTSQFFYNPVATVTDTAKVAVQSRIDTLTATDPRTADQQQELDYLTPTLARLTAFKNYTNQLSGQTSGGIGGAAGGCSLADLMGSGCSPATDVPDIDLQVIIDGLNNGTLIAAAEQNLIKAIADGTGYTGIVAALGSLNDSLITFNNVIENKLNEKILKAAVEQFVMGLVFDLLSGCNSKLISAIIQPNVATAITPLVEHAQKVKSGEIADGLASAVNTTVDATIQEAP